MLKPLAFLGIGLFFGTGLGFLIATTSGVPLHKHDHDHNAGGHDHSSYDHSAHAAQTEATIPALVIE